MMLLGLYPFTRSQFFDNSGKPLTGGFIYAYASGTDTPATLYRDSYGLNPHEWPIELDDAGSEKIYMAPIAYKIVIKNQFGELVEERDAVYSNGFVGGDGSTGSFAVVDNYSALRNLGTQVDAVLVLGRNTPNDGGSGIFILDVDNTGIDDDGIVLVRATTDRYVRQLNGFVEPAWFGAVYGQTLDNGVALNHAIDAGIQYNLPVNISGNLYFNQNYTVKSGAKINISGSVYSPLGITFTFKNGSRLLSAGTNAFSSNIQPVFEQGISDNLKVSWFAGSIYQAITTSIYGYSLVVDKDTNIASDLEVPVNYTVDFIGGAKLVVKGAYKVIINSIAYTGTGEIVHYQDISYVTQVMVGQSYCYLEWFGGKSSTSLDTDNSIAFKAAVAHGRIYLISDATKFYNVPAGSYSNSNGLVMLGNYVPNNNNVNDLVPSTIRFSNGVTLTTGKMSLTALKIDGSGVITATETSINDAIISNAIAYSTGLTKVNDVISANPNFVAVGVYGKIARTSNADGSWSPVTTSINVNLNSVTKGTKLYVLVGQNGMVQTSPDSINWTQRASNITTNLNCVKWFADIGKFIAVGESGKVIHSVDGISWNVVTTTLSSIRSIARFNGKYVIVGGEGKIFTSPDLLTWTQKIVSGLNGTLYSVDASSSLLVIAGYNGVTVTSVDAINFVLRQSPTFNTLQTVKYYGDSNTWVAAGANGTLMKSTDGFSFVVVNTYTDVTDPIYDQVKANGEYVFIGGSGTVITSFDLVKFNKLMAVNGMDVYGIATAPSKIIAIGDAGSIAISTDGTNYTLSTPVTTQNLNRIKFIGDSYFIAGNNGTYLYSTDGVTWNVKSIGSAKNINDIVANADLTQYTVVGSDGLIATCPDAKAAVPLWTIENVYSSGSTPLDKDLFDVVYNPIPAVRKYLASGADGYFYYSTDGHTWTLDTFGSSTDTRIIFDGTTYWVAGLISGTTGALYKSTTGDSFSYVETNNTKFSRVASINGTLVLFGFDGVTEVQTSSDAGVTWKYNTLNSNEYTITAVATTLIAGNSLVIYATSNGKILNGELVSGKLTATKVSINNSLIDIPVTNTTGGDIASSELVDITFTGKIVDTKIYKFTGSFGDLMSRCNISFDKTIGILEDGFISDSTIKSISKDVNTGVFNIANTSKSLGITNTIINAPHATLTYSEDSTLKININGGVIYNGNGIALSNGFAKVFTNGVFDENSNLVKNVSAYSIEGHILESELTEIQAPQTITSSKDHWYGEVAKVDLEGDHFKVNAPIYLSSAPYGSSTLRYRFGSDAMRAMRSFGGRIKTTIKFPSGADKVEQLASRVKALFYIPSYTVDCYDNNGHLYYRNGTNDAFTAGKTLAGSSSVDGATIINYTNVWAGREALNQQLPVIPETDVQNKNVCRDDFGDYSFPAYLERTITPFGFKKSDYLLGEDKTFLNSNLQNVTLEGDLTFESYIIIVNESIAALPVGTTIKVELIPSLPKTIETFNYYFEAPQWAVDSYNGREKQFLQFRDFSTGDLKLAFRAKSTSVTWDVANYKTAPNYYYNFTPASGPEGQFATTYDPKSKLWDLLVDVKIDIENLNWTGAQTIPKYHFSPAYDPEYYTASQIFTLP